MRTVSAFAFRYNDFSNRGIGCDMVSYAQKPELATPAVRSGALNENATLNDCQQEPIAGPLSLLDKPLFPGFCIRGRDFVATASEYAFDEIYLAPVYAFGYFIPIVGAVIGPAARALVKAAFKAGKSRDEALALLKAHLEGEVLALLKAHLEAKKLAASEKATQATVNEAERLAEIATVKAEIRGEVEAFKSAMLSAVDQAPTLGGTETSFKMMNDFLRTTVNRLHFMRGVKDSELAAAEQFMTAMPGGPNFLQAKSALDKFAIATLIKPSFSAKLNQVLSEMPDKREAYEKLIDVLRTYKRSESRFQVTKGTSTDVSLSVHYDVKVSDGIQVELATDGGIALFEIEEKSIMSLVNEFRIFVETRGRSIGNQEFHSKPSG